MPHATHPTPLSQPLPSDARPDLAAHLAEAEAFHGHVCAGIVLGVRMALLGMAEVGIQDPRGAQRKDLMVFVEIDRCATDAITSVTGCRPGRRTMKLRDYGKMAASFINLQTGRAVRVAARDRLDPSAPEPDPDATLRRLRALPDRELFSLMDVRIPLEPGDMPGRPVRSVVCAQCGESVLDAREVLRDGRTLCRPCAEGSDYYLPGGEA